MDLILVAVLAAVAAGAIVFALTRARPQPLVGPDPMQQQLTALRDEVLRMAQTVHSDTDSLSQRIETRLEGIDTRVHKTLTDTQSQSQVLVKDIFERLAEVSAATRDVAEQ